MLREMMHSSSMEEAMLANEEKLEELLAKIDQIDRETTEVFQTLDVSPEQVSRFLDNEDNFSEEHWKEVRCQKTEIDQIRKRAAPDRAALRRTYKQQGQIQQNWIFVR